MTAPQDPFATPSGDQPPAASPPPAYGQQQGAPAGFGTPPTPMRNGFGIAALVLGILAVLSAITIVGGIVLGLLAIVFGILGRGRASRGEANNGGTAIAGLVLGVLGLLGSIALIAFGVSLLNSDSGRELQDCLKGATTAEQQADCQREFEDNVLNG